MTATRCSAIGPPWSRSSCTSGGSHELVAWARPSASNSQPTGFAGRCQLTRTPLSVKAAPMSALVTLNASRASCHDQSMAAMSQTAATTSADARAPRDADSARVRWGRAALTGQVCS